MAKTKKVSINAFEKVVKEKFNNIITEEWNGLEVVITNTISLRDVMSIVAEVANNCFLKDGTYMPEVMQALLDCAVVERYTNIALPSNLTARYDLVARSGIMDFILPRINSNQYNDIAVAIRDKIDYMCDSNVTEFNHAISQMVTSMDQLQKSTSDLFGQISIDDLQRIAGAAGDDRAIEERIVDEYIKKKNVPLRIVGDSNEY